MHHAATVGVAENANTAVLVTVAADRVLLDRREVALTERGMPTHPHHHEGSWAVGRYLDSPGARPVSLAEAVALVERVRAAAARGARENLEALAAEVPVPIASIAIRACPELPPTIEERIADNRAQTVADSVLYRQALAAAAEARGWTVCWYDRDRVFREAAAVLGGEDVDAFLRAMGKGIGAPWQARHKLAAAAALAAVVAPAAPPRDGLSARERALLAAMPAKIARVLDLSEQAGAVTGRRTRYAVKRPGPAVSPQTLETYERDHGVVLPGAYRRFLTDVANGGPGDDGDLEPLSAPVRLPDGMKLLLSSSGECWVHLFGDGSVEEDSYGEITTFSSFLEWYDRCLDRVIARCEAALAELDGGR